MKLDAEIKALGFEVLARYLGLVEAERFITLIQREKFDYTQWRENLFLGLSGDEISRQAMEFHRRNVTSSVSVLTQSGSDEQSWTKTSL